MVSLCLHVFDACWVLENIEGNGYNISFELYDQNILVENYKQAGMVNINPNELLQNRFDPNQEDECCYYDCNIYADVNTIIIHAIIFEYAHTKTDWIMMKDIAK